MDEATRSRLMSRVRGSNTKPEIALRKGLFALGFRYRLHRRDLPGRPDIVLPRFHAVIFVHGCFWHGHDCDLFRLPATRQQFWKDKISRNQDRDATNRRKLIERGWRVLEVWECSMRGRRRLPLESVVTSTADWIRSGSGSGELRGRCE